MFMFSAPYEFQIWFGRHGRHVGRSSRAFHRSKSFNSKRRANSSMQSDSGKVEKLEKSMRVCLKIVFPIIAI